MTEWVSQGEALKLLKADGDAISQPALSQYLAGHPEIERQAGGPGRPMMIDMEALLQSRRTRRARGPSSTPGGELDLPAPAHPVEPETVSPPREQERNPLADRKSHADVSRAESEARLAEIKARAAAGEYIAKDDAVAFARAAAMALVKAFEQRRHVAIAEIRGAKDPREAAMAMEKHEQSVRAALASSLTDLAATSDLQAQAAQ